MARFAAGADIAVGHLDFFQITGLRLGVQIIHRRQKFLAFGIKLGRFFPYRRQGIAVALRIAGEMLERLARILAESRGGGFKLLNIISFIAFNHFAHARIFGHHGFKRSGTRFGNRPLRRTSTARSAATGCQQSARKYNR